MLSYTLTLCLLVGAFSIGVSSQDKDESPSTRLPEFTSRPTETDVHLGDRVYLNCSIDFTDDYVLYWRKGNTALSVGDYLVSSDNGRINFFKENFTISISNITAADHGDYNCMISTAKPMVQIHRVNVLLPPSIQVAPPDTNIIVNEGGSKVLTCLSSGFPKPEVTWYKLMENHHTHNMTRKYIETGEILNLSNVSRVQHGIYQCEANNGEGEPAQHEFHVAVHHKPIVNVSYSLTSIEAGVVDLTCVVIANPKAEVTWSYKGKVLKTIHRAGKKHAEHVHRIASASAKDYGNYTCEATNSLGTSREFTMFSGLAFPIVIKSKRHSDEPHSFTLAYEVKSFAPIIECVLYLRKIIKGADNKVDWMAWHQVVIPRRAADDAHHVSHSYKIEDLEASTTYELYMQARTQAGLSDKSSHHIFVTKGDDTPDELNEVYTTVAISVPQTGNVDNNSNNAAAATSGPLAERVRTAAVLTVVILTAFFY